MKTKRPRLLLCIKDIMLITGKGRSAVCVLRASIRKQFNKPDRHAITVEDFCAFTGLSEEKVNALLE